MIQILYQPAKAEGLKDHESCRLDLHTVNPGPEPVSATGPAYNWSMLGLDTLTFWGHGDAFHFCGMTPTEFVGKVDMRKVASYTNQVKPGRKRLGLIVKALPMSMGEHGSPSVVEIGIHAAVENRAIHYCRRHQPQGQWKASLGGLGYERGYQGLRTKACNTASPGHPATAEPSRLGEISRTPFPPGAGLSASVSHILRQSGPGRSRRAVRAVEPRRNHRGRNSKPGPVVAEIVYVREVRRNCAGLAGRSVPPGGRVEMCAKNLAHAIGGGIDLGCGPVE